MTECPTSHGRSVWRTPVRAWLSSKKLRVALLVVLFALVSLIAAILLIRPRQPRRFLTAEDGFESISIAVETPPSSSKPREPLPIIVWLPDGTSSYEAITARPFEVLARAMHVAFISVMPPRPGTDDAMPTWTGIIPDDGVRVFNAVWMAQDEAQVEDERPVLVGMGEAAATALQIALQANERVAGVIAIHPTPVPESVQTRSPPDLEDLSVTLVQSGSAEPEGGANDTTPNWARVMEKSRAKLTVRSLSEPIDQGWTVGLIKLLPELIDDVLTPRGRTPRADRAALHLAIEAKSRLRDFVWRSVFIGFDAPEVIRMAAFERFAAHLSPEVLTTTTDASLDAALEAHHRVESQWKEPTDNDRLDQAFGLLERRRIVARQDFGRDWDEGMAALKAALGRRLFRYRGFTFFHRSDVEATDNGWLYLSYGALDGHPERGQEIGREIVAALREVGLSPKWNGSFDRRVGIPIHWQKRRLTRPDDSSVSAPRRP